MPPLCLNLALLLFLQVTASSWLLRSSALATIAEVVKSLGQAIIPALPRLVPIVLSSAAAAVEQLPLAEAVEDDVDMETGEERPTAQSALLT